MKNEININGFFDGIAKVLKDWKGVGAQEKIEISETITTQDNMIIELRMKAERL